MSLLQQVRFTELFDVWKILVVSFGTLAVTLNSGFVAATSEVPTGVSVCEGCHGEQGVSSNPLVPTLAGQPYTLIEDNLLAFRAGKRVCDSSRGDDSPSALLAQVMCTNVAGLSEKEIASLSEYFAQKPFKAAGQSFDPDAVAPGSMLHVQKGCEHCHADGGKNTQNMAPVLAGQWSPYLRRAMEAIRSENRKGPKVMNEAIGNLSDKEIEALIQFYASQQERH